MKLLTEKLKNQLPDLYETEGSSEEEIKIPVKFFSPTSNWTWYVIEFDGVDTFFGMVDGHYPELGYFSLSELKSVRGPLGLGIERDKHWNPDTSLAEVRELVR